MVKVSRILTAALIVSLAILGCNREKTDENEADTFSFVVYPGARYLSQLTDLVKKAHTVLKPNEPEAPPTAVYDTDASVDDVANFYVKSYGYSGIARDATNDLSVARPPAYYRGGNIATDLKNVEQLLQKLNVKIDPSKAQGSYKAVEIAPKPNRPRVTIQRPYFDVTTSQVVDRTIILMSR